MGTYRRGVGVGAQALLERAGLVPVTVPWTGYSGIIPVAGDALVLRCGVAPLLGRDGPAGRSRSEGSGIMRHLPLTSAMTEKRSSAGPLSLAGFTQGAVRS